MDELWGQSITTKIPFQFKVATIIATDQVEILGNSIVDGTTKSVFHDITSTPSHNIKFNSFKTLGVSNGYFVWK